MLKNPVYTSLRLLLLFSRSALTWNALSTFGGCSNVSFAVKNCDLTFVHHHRLHVIVVIHVAGRKVETGKAKNRHRQAEQIEEERVYGKKTRHVNSSLESALWSAILSNGFRLIRLSVSLCLRLDKKGTATTQMSNTKGIQERIISKFMCFVLSMYDVSF